MPTDSNSGRKIQPERKPYALKRTVQRLEHNGQEYLVDVIVDTMNQGHKLTQALRICYPDVPPASYSALATKVKKHPYFIAFKEVSMKILNDKGAALQQNMLDLAFNSRSDMVKFSATKDAMDRVYGEAGKDDSADKPLMVFNFSFGGDNAAPIKQVTIDPDAVPEAETL